MAGASAALTACAIGCAGVPPCEVACVAAYSAAIAVCSLNLISCRSSALQTYGYCMDFCPPEPE